MPDDSMALATRQLVDAMTYALDLARKGGASGSTSTATDTLLANVVSHITSLKREQERVFCEALMGEDVDVIQRVLGRYLQRRLR